MVMIVRALRFVFTNGHTLSAASPTGIMHSMLQLLRFDASRQVSALFSVADPSACASKVKTCLGESVCSPL